MKFNIFGALTEKPAHREGIEQALRESIEKACGGRVCYGHSFGPAPKYFIIGDEPNSKDYVMGRPFSGHDNEILMGCYETLRQKKGADLKDIYATYLIKTTLRADQLSEESVRQVWLPILQLEYELTGCEYYVPLGPLVRLFAGDITSTSPIPTNPPPRTLGMRARNIWRELTT